MGFLRTLIRIYSHLFHFLLTLLLIGVSSLALLSGTDLNLGFVPWRARQLDYWLLFSGLFGLLSVILSIAGKLRFLFLLWSVAVFVMLARGFFLTAYTFPGPAEFKQGVYVTLAALVAIIGAWPARPKVKRRRS